MTKSKNKKAFTLAEVLITLGIIGIVATLTIPTLINKTQNIENVTALKKTYSNLNQAILSMAADAGCTGDIACTGLFSTTSDSVFGSALATKFKAIKVCNTGAGCWADFNQYFDGSGSFLSMDNDTTFYKFMSQDGTSFAIKTYGNDCKNDFSTGELGYLKQACSLILIDVNGFKKPNMEGRDVFELWITNGKGASVYPRCGKDDNNGGHGSCWWQSNNACNSASANGAFCTGKIVEQGWQMNY